MRVFVVDALEFKREETSCFILGFNAATMPAALPAQRMMPRLELGDEA